MTVRNKLAWIILAVFAIPFSCARQTSPTGGPKDTIPPRLIRSIPAHEALNFHGNKLQLEFSEDVSLNAPKEQLIVTPTINKDFDITFRRNIVTIELAEALEENTTYTFNFREAIQDITERNPARNLSLAFSTGDYLDSLSVSGTVFDMLRGKPVKDATVALHVENDTFNILEHPATYFTKTDNEGNFKISHLKPNRYFLYAFEDKNRNLIVNSRSESYGFLGEHIELTDTIADVSLGLVRLDAGPLRLTSARPYNTYFNIRTSKNLRTFTVTTPDSTESISYTFGENQANIRIYDTTEKDSLQIHLLAFDSIDNKIDTTLYAKYLTREVTPEQFQMQLTSSSLFTQTAELRAVLTFTKPLREVNFDSLYYQIDSLTRVNFSKADLEWDPLFRTLTITKTLDRNLLSSPNDPDNRRSLRAQAATPAPQSKEENDKPKPLYELHLRHAAFISIEGDSSVTATHNIKPLRPDELSVINIEIRTDEPSYLVQLLNSSYKVIQQVANQPKVRFTNVIPGDYQIRLVIDRNSNGRWDPGNYFQYTEPEPILYYRAPDGSTSIKGVKANWEIGTQGEMFITY